MDNPNEMLGPIAHIYRSNLAYMTRELEDYRVRGGQFEFLLILSREDGLSQETLAKKLKVSKTTSSRAIQNLDNEGYIHKKRDENDLRAYKIYLTEKGKEMIDLIFKKQRSFVNIIFSDFSPEEKEIFRLLIFKASIKLFEDRIPPAQKNEK